MSMSDSDYDMDDNDEEDDLELSRTMNKKPARAKGSPDPPPAKSFDFDKAAKEVYGAGVTESKSESEMDEIMDDMDNLIEESVANESDINRSESQTKDMLESNTHGRIEFENVKEATDPVRKAADADIREQLKEISPKFEDAKAVNYTKKTEARPARSSPTKAAAASAKAKPASTPTVRPATAKPTKAATKAGPIKATAAARPTSAAVKAQPAAKPQPKERTVSKPRAAQPQPSAKDLANAKRASSRIREASEAKRAAEAAKKPSPPKRKVDPVKLKEKIDKTKQKKADNLIKSITKLKKFGMPKTKPEFGKGQNEMDLENEIQQDLLDLELEMDTKDFGKEAIEAD